MKTPPDELPTGYGNPPHATQWKKGQCGNPRLRRRAPPEGAIEAIDRLLLRPIAIVENGTRRRVTTLEAILLQLWQKDLGGDPRALTVRMKYEELAQQNKEGALKVAFVDNDYTRALAAASSTEGACDEGL